MIVFFISKVGRFFILLLFPSFFCLNGQQVFADNSGYENISIKLFSEDESDFLQRKKAILEWFKPEIDELSNLYNSNSEFAAYELNSRKAADIAQITFQLDYRTDFGNELIRNISK